MSYIVVLKSANGEAGPEFDTGHTRFADRDIAQERADLLSGLLRDHEAVVVEVDQRGERVSRSPS